MKSDDFYRGNAPVYEYKGILDKVVSYPDRRDLFHTELLCQTEVLTMV